jgi:hypothetical protein
MHAIMNKKFYLGPKFGTLFNNKWITISELLHPPDEFPGASPGLPQIQHISATLW